MTVCMNICLCRKMIGGSTWPTKRLSVSSSALAQDESALLFPLRSFWICRVYQTHTHSPSTGLKLGSRPKDHTTVSSFCFLVSNATHLHTDTHIKRIQSFLFQRQITSNSRWSNPMGNACFYNNKNNVQ
jgi:hypothetical protein